MKIENRSKLSEFFLSFPALLMVGFALILTIIITYSTNNHNKLLNAELKEYNIKVKDIKSKKYPIMCADTMLQPSEYDLFSIAGKDKIVPIQLILEPSKGYDVASCAVAINQTNSIATPIVKNETNNTKKLNETIKSLEEQIKFLNSTIKNDNETIEQQKRDLSQVYAFSNNQKEKLEKYAIMEAKYAENKELLDKIINHMDISSKSGKQYKAEDLIVNKKVVEKIVSEVPRPKPVNLTPIDITANNYTRILQTKLYVLRVLAKSVAMNKKWDGKFTVSDDEVNKIKLTKAQIDDYSGFNKQLDTSISNLIYILSKRIGASNKVLELEVLNSIK